MVANFERCAVEGAMSWFAAEGPIIEDLGSKDRSRRLVALCRAAAIFRVARTMPTAHDVGQGRPRLSPVLDVLDDARFRRVAADDLVATVRVLRQRLAAAYHRADLLSPATKFLWLLHRDVAIIYDEQARAALGTPRADYDTYVDRWRDRYDATVNKVRRACLSSRTAGILTRSLVSVPPSRVRALVREPWFHMRVFDIRLWHGGKRGS
jgi:hypothetical protein